MTALAVLFFVYGLLAAAWSTFLAFTVRKRCYKVIHGLTATLFVLIASFWGYRLWPARTPPVACDTIHVPPTGCPPGAERLTGFFSESDGSRQDACRLPAGEHCIDELRPGEGFAVELDLRAPTPEGMRL